MIGRRSLLTTLGIWCPPWWKLWAKEPKLDDLQFEVVVRSLTHFLRSGGVLHWREWRQSSQQVRAAFLIAGERVWAERASAIGMASQGKLEAAEILSVSDGGDLKCQILLEEAVHQ